MREEHDGREIGLLGSFVLDRTGICARVKPGRTAAALIDSCVQFDPYDPSTFRHAGQCEHRYTSDPVLLRAILKVRDGASGGYWWVECSACDTAWQDPHYAESVG